MTLPEGKDHIVVLKNAHIVDPLLKINSIGFVAIKGEQIIFVETSNWQQKLEQIINQNKKINIIDCDELLLIPGIIDIHVHTRDFEEKDSGTIFSESAAAAKAGVTAIVCQPNTQPAMDSEKMLMALNAIANTDSKIDLMTYCAITIGRKDIKPVNFNKLSKLPRVVGFSDDGNCVMNSMILKTALEYSAHLDLPIAQHAEDYNLSCGFPLNLGAASNKIGCKGSTVLSESSVIARDLAIASQIPGCHYHAQHISSKESLDMIARAKNECASFITVEVTPHHIHFADKQIKNTNGKVNPPIKSEKHRDAIKYYIKNGIIDCIATDHAPHHKSKKLKTFESSAFGSTSLEALVPVAMSLYRDGYATIERVVEMISLNPAKIIKKSDSIGSLKTGFRANITLIDKHKKWIQCQISKSQNSIFNDEEFIGKAVCTIVGGKVVYLDNESVLYQNINSNKKMKLS